MKKTRTTIEIKRNGDIKGNISTSIIPKGTYSFQIIVHEQPLNNELLELESEPNELFTGTITPTFAELLTFYKNRICASTRNIADKCHVSNQTIANWMNGSSMPKENNCPNVQDATKFLRLTKSEKDLFMKAAGCFKYDMYVEYPEIIFKDYINELFNELLREPVLILLTQAGWDEPPCRNALLFQAERRYGVENVLHIQLPSNEENIDTCFSDIGEQLKFEDVNNVASFKKRIDKLLENGNELFLLVSRFENGTSPLRKELANVLRSLCDYHNRFNKQLHIILCGGKSLESFKYTDDEDHLSLLDIAEDKRWQEIGLKEVYAICSYYFKDLSLDNELVNKFLELTGGHPQLLKECLTIIGVRYNA